MKLENIVIYCGSHFGAELSYASFAGELAEAIAKSGRTITYGGGTVGLMGIVADAAMAAGGKVIGVIPEVFILKEQAHRGITELIEVPDMVERKKIMIGSGHAFIALPTCAFTEKGNVRPSSLRTSTASTIPSSPSSMHGKKKASWKKATAITFSSAAASMKS